MVLLLQDSVRFGLSRRRNVNCYQAVYDMITEKHVYVGCSLIDTSDGTPLGQVFQIAYRDSTYTAFTVEFPEHGEPIFRK